MWFRCLIALIVAWGVLLGVPALRSQSLRMNENLLDTSGGQVLFLSDERTLELARQNPESRVLALQALRAQVPRYKPLYNSRFDELLARWPDDLTLRRARMIEGTLAHPVLPFYAPYKGAKTLPTQKDRDEILKRWNYAQRATFVEQARAGARQAPADAFFPWSEAMVLWNRDEEPALRALEKAASRSGFNDGIIDLQRERARWTPTGAAPAWDQKQQLLSEALLPHYSQMRALQREVVGSGIARYRRGDKAGAYRRWSLALRAAGAFRRSQLNGKSSFFIGLLVSESLQGLVWSQVAGELGWAAGTKPSEGAKFAAFVARARRDGQSPLADLAARERAAFWARSLDSAALGDIERKSLRLDAPDSLLQLQLPWATRSLFWFSVAGAGALLLCAPVGWLERRLHRPFFGRFSPFQIAFLSAPWLVGLGTATYFRPAPEWIVWSAQAPKPTGFAAILSVEGVALFDNVWSFWGAVGATLLAAMLLCYAQRARVAERADAAQQKSARGPLLLFWWGVVLILAPLPPLLDLLGLTDVSLNYAWWLAARAAWLGLGLLALGRTLWVLERRAVAPRQRLRDRTLIASAFAAIFGVSLYLWFGNFGNWIAAVLMISSATWSAGLLLTLAWSDRAARGLALRSLGVALQTLGGVALVCSVALLLASLWALPVRARQNRIMDDYMARGEVNWLRAQPQVRAIVAKNSL